MATVLPTPPTARTKYDATLERELGRAAGRIRANDLLAGGLWLAVLVLGYAAAAVVVDKCVDLPAWVRQLGFGGFVAAAAAIGYAGVVRPLRRAINPRFAAREVERIVPDSKNAVVNWVDLRDRELSDAVRTAVGVRAAEGVAGADVQKVAASRRAVWPGVLIGVLVAVLAGLFVAFKPAPFLSLLGRAFAPFTAGRIATRTQLEITAPETGDATVTAGDPLTVAVYVRGTVPDPDGPDRVRLLVRHNPESPDDDELPLDVAGGAREWAVRLPQSVIQNGFWYRVAAGDARTPEYRVAVRSRPLVTEYEARYEYPEYTRLKPETDRDPRLSGLRGTQVTLTAKTNRGLKRAWVQFDAGDAVPAEVVGEGRDALRVRLTLAEPGTYRLGFTSAADEPGEPTPAYPIQVTPDQPPTVTLTAPDPNEVTLPANGLLKVDGVIGDDFGVASAALVVKVVGRPDTLKPKPYRDGKPLRRDADGSYPTTLEYKDSLPLTAVTDQAGNPVALTPDTVLEFWVEATDNCTVPKPNVGRSKPKRVRLVTPVVEPAQQEQLKKDGQQRRAEEQQHQAAQDQKLRAEKRDPQQPRPDADQKVEPGQPGEPGGEKTGQGQGARDENRQPDPNGGAATGTVQPGSKGAAGPEGAPPPKPDPNAPGGQKAPDQPAAGADRPKPAGAGDQPPPAGTPNSDRAKPDGDKPEGGAKADGGQQSKPQDPAAKAADQSVDQKAKEVEKALADQERQPAEARPQEPSSERKEPAAPGGSKGSPQSGQPGQQAAEKPKPAADPNGGPSDPSGTGDKPKPDAQPNPAKPDAQQNGKADPAGETPKAPPAGVDSAQEKATKPDSQGGAAGREPTSPDTPAGPKPTPQPNQPKGKPESGAGGQKPEPGQKKPSPDEQPGTGRDDKPTEPGDKKPAAPNAGRPDTKANAEQKPATPKSTPEPGAGGQPKPDPSPGASKGSGDNKPAGGGPGTPDGQPAGGGGQPDGQQAKGAEKPTRPPGELARELGERDGKGSAPTAADKEVDRLMRDADDLNSPDEGKRKNAEQEFDNAVGRGKREDLQRKLKSGDPKQREEAKKDVDELAKKKRPPEKPEAGGGDGEPKKGGSGESKGGGGAGGRQQQQPPSKEDIQKAADTLKDLNSDDPAKRQAAEQKVDQALGKNAREQAQQDMKDLTSTDPKKQQAAQQRLQKAAEQAAKQAGQPGGDGASPSKEEKDRIRQQAQDLNSPDETKRKDAEQAFDQKVGQEERQKLQQDMKAAGGDAAKQQAAADRALDRAAQQDQRGGRGDKGPPPSKEEIERLADKAKDLNSADAQKRAAAEKELDRAVGENARKQLQQDLKARSAAKQAETEKASRQKFDEAAEKAKQEGGQPPSKADVQKAADTLKDLNSPDAEKRQAAERAVDQAVGKANREKLQKDLKDLGSDDHETREAAKQRVQDAVNEARKPAGQQPQPPPSREDVDQWAKTARDLNSPDGPTRQAAEQEFDRAVGKDVREQLQNQLRDPKAADEAKADAARRAAEDAARADQQPKDRRRLGGLGGGAEEKLHEGDPKNRLKTAELRLKDFEKNRYNKEIQNRLGYTQDQYEQFLKAYEERVARLRDEADNPTARADASKPAGPPTLNVGEGSGGRKAERRGDGTSTATGSAGPGTAPPGYSDAQRRFAEEAAKLKRGKDGGK